MCNDVFKFFQWQVIKGKNKVNKLPTYLLISAQLKSSPLISYYNFQYAI